MRRRLHPALLLALLLTITACDPSGSRLTPDSITISATGLPKELEPDIIITGPDDYDQTITETTTLDELAPGTYTITANTAAFNNNPFNPNETTHQVTLEPGGTRSVRVLYAPHRAYSLAVLEHLNEYRMAVGVPPVTLDANGSLPNWLHARYLGENAKTGHIEDPNLPWYTPEGAQAGLHSNVSTTGTGEREPRSLMRGFAQAPFHLMSLLDPRTTSVRHGYYLEQVHGLTASTLEPLRTGAWPAGRRVYFPGDGQTTEDLAHFGENPSPPHACPIKYHEVVNGLPIFVMRGYGNTPRVQRTSITAVGTEIEHCVVVGTTQYGADNEQADFINEILDGYGATLLLPLHPLEPLTTYNVSITTADGLEEWTFHTADVEAERH